MSGGGYSPAKRQRELEQARKKQEKLARRMERRTRGPAEIEVVSAADVQRGLMSVDQAMRALEERQHGGHSAAGVPVRLFVGNLPDDCTVDDLRAAFGAFGPVIDAIVMVDRATRVSRGFGFVTMGSRKDAPRAIAALDKSELKGRAIVVNVATDRTR